nr:hypothetical protein [Tanacetum cinerariifolium]
PPTNKDLEILFQPMFDEYMEPPRVERPMSPAQAVQAPINSTGTPSATTIDQDAHSPNISPSSLALQSHQGVAAESTFMEDNPVAPVDNNPFINVFPPEPSSGASSSGDLIELNVNGFHDSSGSFVVDSIPFPAWCITNEYSNISCWLKFSKIFAVICKITQSTKDSEEGKIGLLIMHQLIWGLVVTGVN